MIVVDANIIAYLWIPGHEVYKSRELLVKDSNWWVPPIYISEMRSVLLLYVRKDILKMNNALDLMEKIESQFEHSKMDVPSKLVLTLGNQSTCSAYDCEYAGLALLLDCPLLTLDKKLLQAFPEIAKTPENYLHNLT